MGKSTGDFKSATTADFATGVESAITYLKWNPRDADELMKYRPAWGGAKNKHSGYQHIKIVSVDVNNVHTKLKYFSYFYSKYLNCESGNYIWQYFPYENRQIPDSTDSSDDCYIIHFLFTNQEDKRVVFH